MYKGSSTINGGSSKLLWKWEKNKEHEMHQTKLQEIKANRSHALPQIPDHQQESMNNSQALRQQHFLYAQYLKQLEIEKQNEMYVRKLLSVQATQSLKHSQLGTAGISKLSQTNNKSISFTKSNNIIQNFSSTSNTNSGISMKNKNTSSSSSQRILPYPSYQVLNEQRQTQAFFRRIEQTKSVFDNSKWSKQAAEHIKALKVCSKFTPDDVVVVQRQHRSSQELRDNDKTLRGTMSSVYQQDKFKNKSLSQTTQLNSSEISTLNQKNDQNTVINVGKFENVKLPSDFFKTQQSKYQQQFEDLNINVYKINGIDYVWFFNEGESQKKQFLKQILAEKKQMLYRKTAEIEGEQFFAEIKIENGNLQIDLENAQGMVFTKILPQAEGMRFFERDCNSDFKQLFNKIQINKTSKIIQFRQIKPLVDMNVKESYSKSVRQTKYPTSRSSAIFNEDDKLELNQDNRTSSVKTKQRNIIAENKKSNVSTVLFPKVSVSHREELNDKRNNKNNRELNDLQNVSNSVKLTKSQQLQQQSKLKQQQQKDQTQKDNIKQTKEEQSLTRQVKDRNGKEDKIVKNIQVNQNKTKSLNNQQHNPVQNSSNQQKNNNNIIKITQKQADNNKINQDPSDYEEDYEDPFEKFDEEDRQNKEKLKDQSDQDHNTGVDGGVVVSHHHPHEITDKKMNSFSFQQTNQFKKNGEQEEQKNEEEGEDEEIQNDEYDEDSSGTQYEINDEDKQRIEKKQQKQRQQNEENQDKKKEESKEEEEEEYEQEEYADEFE